MIITKDSINITVEELEILITLPENIVEPIFNKIKEICSKVDVDTDLKCE